MMRGIRVRELRGREANRVMREYFDRRDDQPTLPSPLIDPIPRQDPLRVLRVLERRSLLRG